LNDFIKVRWVIGDHIITGCQVGNGDILAICFPGFSLSGEWMAKHYPDLYQDKTCYFLNWPGLGDESLEKTPFELTKLKEWILQIGASKNWLKKTIICHSFGARVVLKLLSELPTFDELIMIAPVVKIRFWENLIQNMPSILYKNLINNYLKHNAINCILKIVQKIGLSNAGEKNFIQTHFASKNMNLFLIHYALALPTLKLKRVDILNALKSIQGIKIYLFNKDPFCDNQFWQKIEPEIPNCSLIFVEGGHFKRIKNIQ